MQFFRKTQTRRYISHREQAPRDLHFVRLPIAPRHAARRSLPEKWKHSQQRPSVVVVRSKFYHHSETRRLVEMCCNQPNSSLLFPSYFSSSSAYLRPVSVLRHRFLHLAFAPLPLRSKSRSLLRPLSSYSSVGVFPFLSSALLYSSPYYPRPRKPGVRGVHTKPPPKSVLRPRIPRSEQGSWCAMPTYPFRQRPLCPCKLFESFSNHYQRYSSRPSILPIDGCLPLVRAV